MLADFVILLRALLDLDMGARWYPQTLVYVGRGGGFEVFARARSKKWFEKVKVLLNVTDKDDLMTRLDEGKKAHGVARWSTFWDAGGLVSDLLDLERMDTL